MKKHAAILLVAWLCSTGVQAQDAEQERLRHAGEVLTEILNVPDNLPKSVLDRADCVLIIPSFKKFALGIGASIGRGAMSCRSGSDFTGPWGAPAMYALEGGPSIGQTTDFVLVVIKPKGFQSLLKDKVKLGGDVIAAVGPVGRNAEATDVFMQAEILTYCRSRGLFAGVSLEGSVLRPNDSANNKLYGREITAREILLGRKVKTPASGQLLISALQKASPKNLSDAKSAQEGPSK